MYSTVIPRIKLFIIFIKAIDSKNHAYFTLSLVHFSKQIKSQNYRALLHFIKKIWEKQHLWADSLTVKIIIWDYVTVTSR